MESQDGGLVLELSVDGVESWASGQSTVAEENLIASLEGDSIKYANSIVGIKHSKGRCFNNRKEDQQEKKEFFFRHPDSVLVT